MPIEVIIAIFAVATVLALVAWAVTYKPKAKPKSKTNHKVPKPTYTVGVDVAAPNIGDSMVVFHSPALQQDDEMLMIQNSAAERGVSITDTHVNREELPKRCSVTVPKQLLLPQGRKAWP